MKARLDITVADLGAQKLKNIAEPVHAYSVEVGKPAVKAHAKKSARRRLFLTIGAMAMVACTAAGFAAWRLVNARAEPTVAAAVHIPTLLIAPLVNATGDVKFDATVRRISDKMIGYLTGSIYWKLIAGALPTKDGVVSTDALKMSDAEYLLSGNLEMGGPTLRIFVYLTDAHSGERLWATTMSPVLEDLNAGQAEDELAGRAAAAVRRPLWRAELKRLAGLGQSETAYGCLLLGVLRNPSDIARARVCEEAKIKTEPDSVHAWLGLAQALTLQWAWGWGLAPGEASAEKRAGLTDRMYETSSHALQLAPEDGDVRFEFATANYARCDRDRVRVEVRKTIALNPYSAMNLGYLGGYLAWIGDFDEGVEITEKANKLDHTSGGSYWWLVSGARHFNRGEYQLAYEDFQRYYIEGYWLSHVTLIYSLVPLGRIDEAKTHVTPLLKLYPTLTVHEVEQIYKNWCFSKDYRDLVVDAMRKVGLPE